MNMTLPAFAYIWIHFNQPSDSFGSSHFGEFLKIFHRHANTHGQLLPQCFHGKRFSGSYFQLGVCRFWLRKANIIAGTSQLQSMED